MNDENTTLLAVLAHILGLFMGFVGPLIIFAVASNDKFSVDSAKSALNWQISLLIYLIISGILSFVLIGFVLLFVFGILNIIFCIYGAVKASKGELYIYPLSIKFFKI